MSCAIKNEKGLYASCSTISLISEKEALKAREVLNQAIAGQLPECSISEQEAQAASKLLDALLSLTERAERGWGDARNYIVARAWPVGWANTGQPLGMEEADVQREWTALAAMREAMPQALPALKKMGFEWKELDSSVPKSVSLKKTASWSVLSAGAQSAARAGEAWAIWMGGPRELGYMDGKKRPAGAAAARLFESEAAALRTAKAASFGVNRGPAAVVKLLIEPLEIVGASKGGDEVRAELAKIEASAIERSMEEASLDRLREALGEAPVREPQKIEQGSLAGAEEGFAYWAETEGHADESGFVNYNGGRGPLVGAMLHPSEAKASLSCGYYTTEGAVVRVRSQPVEICAVIGEPNVTELGRAIEIERDRAELAALALADAGALKARAAALQTGDAKASVRRSRSL